MLQLNSMDSTARRWLAVLISSVTCLLLIPQRDAFSATLRDEAVKYRTEGYARQQKGDLENALNLYQKAAALDATYPTPYNDAGILLEERGQIGEAKQAYEQALAINPNYLEAHANLAMLYERMGEKEKAMYHWLKRYELGDPSDAGTARAEERLTALGFLKSYPGLKGKISTSRHVTERELKAHEQTVDDFHAVTEHNGRWQ